MKEEIKEIFKRMNDLIEHQFDNEYHTECDLFKDIQMLLDYITNLQEENVRFREIICFNEDYKSRIDKAVSILKDLKYIDKYKFTWDRDFNKALNILQGEDKE